MGREVQIAAVYGVFSVMVRESTWNARRRRIESVSFVDISDGVTDIK